MTDLRRIITTEQDAKECATLIQSRKRPFTVAIKDGAHRSNKQNKLQRLWVKEAAEQLKDGTAEDYRGYCKLHFGVPIMREQDEEFRKSYDRVIMPLDYELKIEAMKDPLNFPVTSLMHRKEKGQYLNKMEAHLRGLGVRLTDPEALKYE